MNRLVITPTETLFVDVDPGAFMLITARDEGGQFVETRHVRQEIMIAREGPKERGAGIGRFPPLYEVVYVQDGLALDDACARRAVNALWPCDCGCVA